VRHPRVYGVSLSGAFDQTGEPDQPGARKDINNRITGNINAPTSNLPLLRALDK
jgi:hypothetical protein